MSLTQRLSELIQACFSGIWIESYEHSDAIAEIASLCQKEQWQLLVWNIADGLRANGPPVDDGSQDPLAALTSFRPPSEAGSTQILVLENFHRFLTSAEIVQAVAAAVLRGKVERQFVVILSPKVELPVELEKLFVVLQHDLPTADQLEGIARGIATEAGEMPEGGDLTVVLDAAVGMTRREAENAFSLSLVRHGRLEPSAIWEIKTQSLKKSGTLTLHQGTDTFDLLGGLDSLKAFTKRALLNRNRRQSGPIAKGVLLLSPPGCGKSQFCKTLGNEVNRPVIILDVGSLMGSLVGQSEQRTREALRTIDALSPCIVMLDEVEKAFSGVASQNDSGVSSRMFGTFLTWLNDHDSDVFVVCTANDVKRLPPEFSRAERFDGVFFLDLPDRGQKDQIWDLYLQRFSLSGDQARPDDDGWTGAEIKSCCRLASLLDVPLSQAAQNIVPVAKTSEESVSHLRQWADGRCLSADQPGVFRLSSPPTNRRRKVSTKPSVN